MFNWFRPRTRIVVVLVNPSDFGKGRAGRLSKKFEQKTVRQLREGESAYTLPWAVFADLKRRLFIVGTYPVYTEPGGTVTLEIMRKGGIIIVKGSTVGNNRYTPEKPCYVGVTEKDYIPAVIL